MPERKTITTFEELRDYLNAQYKEGAYFMKLNEERLEILLGKLHQDQPDTVLGYLTANGYTEQQVSAMSDEQLIDAFREIHARTPSRTENLTAALDLIFHALFGWPEGTAGKLTPAQAFIALEHAMDYDARDRPSIWDITK